MGNDLASRIGDGAVAVLELVPGEQRFADLSAYVLKGGASRFAPVVLDEEFVRYVLPVGIPAAKLDYGTLLVQKSRCALVWRSDPARPYHAMILDLDKDTVVSQGPATIRGEVWGRFDLRHPGQADMTFLVPPVVSPALPRMLHRVLVEEPGAQRARLDVPALPAAVVDGPDIAREVEPEAAPEDAPTQLLAALTAAQAPSPAPAAQAPIDPADVPTQAMEAIRPEPEPRPAPAPVLPKVAPGGATAAPTSDHTWTPRRTDAPAGGVDDLYRDRSRTTPDARPAYQPAAASFAPAPAVEEPALPTASERRPLADVPKGFLTGLLPTLIIGALFVVAKLLGWLG